MPAGLAERIQKPRTVAMVTAASVAAVAIAWFVLRSDGPSGTYAVVANTRRTSRSMSLRAPKPAPSPALPSAPSRVDESWR